MSNAIPSHGMISEAQKARIDELSSSPKFSLPLAGFLKNVTGNLASSVDELTNAQAKDVIGILLKLVPQKNKQS